MIVEIEVQEISKYGLTEIAKVGDTSIYRTTIPLIISPSSTRFLFLAEDQMKSTILNCSSSAKCKLFDLLQENFFSVLIKEDLGPNLQNLIAGVPSFLSPEDLYDKVKGLVYGFGIGALCTLPKEFKELRKIERAIQRTLEECNAFPLRAEDQKNLKKLVEQYAKMDPLPDNVKHGLSFSYFDKFSSEYGGDRKQYLSNLSSYTQEIKNYYRERAIQAIRGRLRIDTRTFKSAQLTKDNVRDLDFFNVFIKFAVFENRIRSFDYLRSNRMGIATDAVFRFRADAELGGKTWEASEYQDYFQKLREHINDAQKPFNLNATSSIILKSIAACLLKGEDFDDLASYLIENGVSDFRYAFAIWGAMQGYVSIPRAVFSRIRISKECRYSLANIVSTLLENGRNNDAVDKDDIEKKIIRMFEDVLESAHMYQGKTKEGFRTNLRNHLKQLEKEDEAEVFRRLRNSLVVDDYWLTAKKGKSSLLKKYLTKLDDHLKKLNELRQEECQPSLL